MLDASPRSRNLRQLLIRAARTLNAIVATELDLRGYADIRPAQSALLANLGTEGGRVTDIAERAGMTKQAMGQLVMELESLGYVKRRRDKNDRRAHVVTFTKPGWKLMEATLEVVDEIEARYRGLLGENVMNGLRTGLTAFIEHTSRK